MISTNRLDGGFIVVVVDQMKMNTHTGGKFT